MKTVTFSLDNGNKELYKDLEVNLVKMDGVVRALIDVTDGDLTIEFNDELIDTMKIKAAIENQGAKTNVKSTE